MTYEDACFQFLLLKGGIDYEYRRFINSLLENETPLLPITTELSFMGDDIKNVSACLYSYFFGKSIDTESVCTTLRLFLRNEYFSGKISREQCVNIMRVSSVFMDYWGKPAWHRMNLVASFCAIHDWLSEEQMEIEFEKILRQYLETGFADCYSV